MLKLLPFKNISFVHFLFLSLFLLACERPEPEPSKEEVLKANAEHNNNLFPGVGNVSYEEKLIPSSLSQLVIKLPYKEDTLGFYGKVNATGQLEYIHTLIKANKAGNELFVTEIFPEDKISRQYTITNNVKSRLVIETEFSAKPNLAVNILDMDWATGKAKTLKSFFIKDGQKLGEYTKERFSKQLDIWNCDKAQPSDDISKEVDNHLEYFACGGLAYDTHPTLIAFKGSILEGIEAIKAMEEYKALSQEIDKLKEEFKNTNILKSILDGLPTYKFERTRLYSLLKKLEELYKLLNGQKVIVTPILVAQASDLDYDEYTDKEIKLTFLLQEKASGIAYTDKPVFFDLQLLIPGTNTAVYKLTNASNPINGMVVFKIDPLTIENIKKLNNLEAQYSFAKDNGNPSAKEQISLKFNNPYKLEAVSGNNQVGEPAKKLANPLKIKVTDDVGRPLSGIAVEWKVKKGIGFIISDAKTNSHGIAEAQWTLGNEGEQEVEVIVRKTNGTLTSGSPLIFVATAKKSCGVAPVITNVIQKCGQDGVSIILEIHFKDEDGGFDLSGSYFGTYTPDRYPVKLEFKLAGSWNDASNAYSVRLVSGNLTNGIIELSLAKSMTGRTCEPKPGYINRKEWFEGWRVSITDKCQKASNLVNLNIFAYQG